MASAAAATFARQSVPISSHRRRLDATKCACRATKLALSAVLPVFHDSLFLLFEQRQQHICTACPAPMSCSQVCESFSFSSFFSSTMHNEKVLNGACSLARIEMQINSNFARKRASPAQFLNVIVSHTFIFFIDYVL